MKYQSPRGTKDILPEESRVWQYLEDTFRKVCERFNYEEIRTPILEEAPLFIRSIGETSDIVGKEMYIFKDRGGREIALRPEGTAPVIRACLQNNLIQPSTMLKLYYIGPMFRYERPQKGRYRQFHHFGVEAIGSENPAIDTEVISLCLHFLEKIGIKDFELQLNSVGCKSCREFYKLKLQDFLKDKIDNLCSECKIRYEKNPLRILDCKLDRETLSNLPPIFPHLDEDCKEHFNQLKENLNSLNISYKINPYLVRGLDYYTRTAFEIVSKDLGSKNSLAGGGRYDNLVEEFGGSPTPAVGFALSGERLSLLLKEKIKKDKSPKSLKLFVATLGKKADKLGLQLTYKLRRLCFRVDMDYRKVSIKSQMKVANRQRADLVIIIGEDEIKEGKFTIKDMKTGKQEKVPMVEMEKYLKKKEGSE